MLTPQGNIVDWQFDHIKVENLLDSYFTKKCL